MAARRKPSPVLGAAAMLIEDAGENFVTNGSRFRHTFEAPVAAIQPDSQQARKMFDDDALRALAATMESNGQLQPILVRRQKDNTRQWILVAGERRWRAAKIAGWQKILAIEFDGNPEVASLLENLQRVDLNPWEEASGLQRLIEQKGWSQTRTAEALGKTESEISSVLRILSLPDETLQLLTSEHPVSRSVMIELARVPNDATLQELVEYARQGKLTVKAVRLTRATESALDPASPTSQRSHPSKFNFTTLERVAERLNNLRSTSPSMNEVDRARLVRLREEIDMLLKL